jgi:REP element-mobilizing transposase RayT
VISGLGPATVDGVPRAPRLRPANGIFHITSRGNRRQSIFFEDADREWFLYFLEHTVKRFDWTCNAYCLMDNHVHLLVETPKENLSEGMQWLLGRYALDFNWRHGLDGHLFQGRFKSQVVDSNWHLLELARYIVLNPVRAGMCAAAADWPWSSYGASVGATDAPTFLALDWLLSQFGRQPDAARATYAAFVSAGPIRASP